MMTEGGHFAWKRQGIDQHRGPPGNYDALQSPLPDPPEGMRWSRDKDTREWSLERKMEEDIFAEEITQHKEFLKHEIKTSDTFTGICLRYKISPAELRKANGGFSGTNLFLAPNPLKIPKRETVESKDDEGEAGGATPHLSNRKQSPSVEDSLGSGTHTTAVVSSDDDCDSDAAMAVFEESLRFEQSQSLPPPQPIGDRKSSSTSIYPPIESIEDIGRDEIELEKTWEAAATPKKKFQENRAMVAARMKSCCDDRTRCTCCSTNSCMSQSSRRYPYLALSNPHAAARATSLRNPSPYLTTMSMPHSSVPLDHLLRGLNPHHAVDEGKRTTEDDELLAMKLAAYEGREITPVARMPDSLVPDQQAEATVVDYYEHPSDISVNAVQADLVGQDYGSHFDVDYAPTLAAPPQASGYVESVQSLMATASGETTEATVIESGPMEKVTADAWDASATEALVLEDSTNDIVDLDSKPPAVEQWRAPSIQHEMHGPGGARVEDAAEATVLEFEDHPSTVPIASNAIHAEFVCQDFTSSMGCVATNESNIQAASVSSGVGLMGENTDIGGGTTESTIIRNAEVEEAWAASDVGEAQLLEGIVRSEAVEEDDLSDLDDHDRSDGQESAANIAEVIDITENVHPSELVPNTAQAEFIGTDSRITLPFSQNSSLDESGGASSAAPADEAQVLHDFPDDVAIEPEVKEIPDPDSQWSSDSRGGSFVMADGEAEVVGITENVHPSELVDEATQAELIGTDSSVAIAIPSNQQEVQSALRPNEARVGTAEIVVEEESDPAASLDMVSSPEQNDSEPREAQATLISEQEFAHFDRQVSSMAEATTESADTRSLAPATAVSILAEQNNGETLSNSPQKSEMPVANRTPATGINSSPFDDGLRDTPAMPRDGISALNAVASEPTTPTTLGGGHGDVPLVMAPPSATVTGEENSNFAGESSDVLVVSEPLSSGSSRLQAFSSSNFYRNTGSVVARSTYNVMDLLFGNRDSKSPDESMGRSVYPRTLLPSTVIYSDATKSWVTTVNTNQKALETNNVEESSKAVRAFSVPTRKQALCLARAWSPPKMHAFESNPTCLVCENQFNVFKRASHCRNCGVCICNPCTAQWLPKMLPNTYNIKRESMMNVCNTCDWLCSSFRLALLEGDQDKAVALHSTGNINLTTPFANVKGELFYPVHCAVLGGNLQLLKWLIEDHCCPLRSIRVSSGRPQDCSGTYTPILTSKGRSLLAIALENRNIDIVQYLVVKKRMQISAEKGLSKDILSHNLDLVLRVLPQDVFGQQQPTPPQDAMFTRHTSVSTMSGSENLSVQAPCEQEFDSTAINDGREELVAGDSHDDCIICFSNSIDCVATPCGHQICCLQCSRSISRCPVCAGQCSFMRVYRA